MKTGSVHLRKRLISMLKLAFILILSLQSLTAVVAQEHVTISGKMIDLETKEPLSFATINIQNTPKGVVANEDGSFDFTFPAKFLRDTIVFSMAGYQHEKYLIQSLIKPEPIRVELLKKAVLLAEVVVTNKKLTAREVLDIALANIKNNYPTKPFEFKAFYRDYKQENDKCISVFEAAISAYDKGYSKVSNKSLLREKVVLEQVRKSLNVAYQTHVFATINVMKELLQLNDVRYQSRSLNKREIKYYQYEIAGYDIVNNRLMYKIQAKDDWRYFIYVDVSTYAIPRIEMNFEWSKGVDENTWVRDSIRYNQTAATMLMDFQMIDGIYYPRYCSFTANLEAFDPSSDDLLFTSYLMQEYMVTDIDFNPEEKPEKEDRMDPHLKIEDQSFTYDPEFWEHYNIIKLHPRNKKLIEGLEERMKLEDQFSENSQ